MSKQNHLQCPVCHTDFGDVVRCTGCGADLSKLMEIAARALHLRQQARQALRSARYGQAYKLSVQAQNLQDTALGQKLLRTTQLMDAIRIGARA
jgi:hypothetical protein